MPTLKDLENAEAAAEQNLYLAEEALAQAQRDHQAASDAYEAAQVAEAK